MAFKVCEDCGCRVYGLGCVNCNEIDYIEQQETFDIQNEIEEAKHRETAKRREEALRGR